MHLHYHSTTTVNLLHPNQVEWDLTNLNTLGLRGVQISESLVY